MKRPFVQLLLFLPLLFLACSEFISPDVSTWKVHLLSPADTLFSSQKQHFFRWEGSPQIESYRFQLASPSFESPQSWIDTLTKEASLRLRLEEGSYQWRVRGENESSHSPFQTRRLTVDQSPPAIPWANYPHEGDSINQNLDPLELRWQSWDESSMVKDSLYLYRWHNGIPAGRWAYFFDYGTTKKLALADRITESGGAWQEYRWEIKSFDQVGNSNCSKLFNFWVQ